jgi:hypothetical protein
MRVRHTLKTPQSCEVYAMQRAMADTPRRTRIKLDFTTPNAPTEVPVNAPGERSTSNDTTTARRIVRERPMCPYCFQPGRHRSAKDCLNALGR